MSVSINLIMAWSRPPSSPSPRVHLRQGYLHAAALSRLVAALIANAAAPVPVGAVDGEDGSLNWPNETHSSQPENDIWIEAKERTSTKLAEVQMHLYYKF